MHSLLIQLLIAYIDREFSPEELKQLLDEAEKELGYAGMIPFYEIHNRVYGERARLHEKFSHPGTKYYHRNVVKEVVGKEAEQAGKPRPPVAEDFSKRSTWASIGDAVVEAYEQQQADETPADWKPREPLRAKMDFS